MGKDKQNMDVEIRHCSVGDQWPQCSNQNKRVNDTPFQIIRRFSFSRYIAFTMCLCIVYI